MMGPDFKPEKRTQKGFSDLAIRWLDMEAQRRGIHIQHALNSKCGEVRIGSSRHTVDGFCAERNLIFEMEGCFYHACSSCYQDRADQMHPYYPLTFAEVRERTAKKIQYFKDLGYEVVEKWECEFNKEHPRPVRNRPTMTEADVLDKVKTGELFGLIKVDILTPEWLKPRLDEFPAIFKNCPVSREDISPMMRRYCEENNKLRKPTKLLISSHKADQILLITPLLKYYLQLGLQVTKIHYVVHFPDHKPCFRDFADKVSDARRRGDRDPESTVLASTYKLLGNSSYGRVVMDHSKQTDTTYVNGFHATYLMNQNRFKMCRKVDDDLFEIEMYKKKHRFDLPLHLGVFVYGYAKLRMCQWVHQFVQKYLPRDMYELSQMDTDSCYMGLARPTLDECVRPSMLKNYYHCYDEWFPTLSCPAHKLDFIETKMAGREWVMQECCRDAHNYELRTPGKFKVEFQGDGIVALCSKTYDCFGEKEGTKRSCKGIQKSRNLDVLTRDTYLDVLKKQQAGSGVNKGFVANNGRIYSYTQTRFGLSYLYCKRLVDDDGVSTRPLNL